MKRKGNCSIGIIIATFVVMHKCWNCDTELPPNARFCVNCGARQHQEVAQATKGFTLPEDIELQLNEAFFDALLVEITEQQNPNLYDQYRERMYDSGFRDILLRKIQQFVEHLKELEKTAALTELILKVEQQALFTDLLDFYIVHFCKDLNVHPISERILQYQGKKWENIQLLPFLLDYLDFDREEETYYIDFLKMPMEKIRNASRFFLFPETEERILLICDQSAFGSCKEGFAFTDKALYWKAYLEKARVVHFDQLRLLEKNKEWITINGFFFNVNQGFNIKMLKLLRKIKDLQFSQ